MREIVADQLEVRRPTGSRLAFLDNLKAFLAVLVVMHHAGQPYGPTGGKWPFFHAEKFRLLGPFFHCNASFFMGLFFLISGYFLQAAYDKKRPWQFVGDRFRRLGIPVLIFGFVVMPLVHHYQEGQAWSKSFFPFEWDHLWFLGHLQVYALLYTAFRLLRGDAHKVKGSRAFPSNGSLLIYAILLAVVSTVVRIWYPMDHWIREVIVAEPAHFPQYCSLFVFGVIAARYSWLEKIPERSGRLWLSIGVLAVIVRFAYSIAHADFLNKGGLFVSYIWNQWEALLCVGMCAGLLYWFREYGASTSPWARFMGKHAFALYILHLPILVEIQWAMEKTSLGPLTLTILTGTMTIAVCYAISGGYDSLKRVLRSKPVLPQVAVE